jgi:proliferating cell nuclear antigen PCNA
MKLIINDLIKADKFTLLFQNLKSQCENINIDFLPERMYIQGMDTSHVSLFEMSLDKSWFDTYEVTTEDIPVIGINNVSLHKVLHTRFPNQIVELSYSGEPEYLDIDFKSEIKEEFNKSFQIPIMDIDMDKMHIPEIDYDADLEITTSTLSKMIDEFAIFDEKIHVTLGNDIITLKAGSSFGNMTVSLSIDDVEEYAVEPDSNATISYSIKHFQQICSYHKLTKIVKMGFCDSNPMMVSYELDESSCIKFYLAPSINDDE